jgi:hypothetical protein
VIGTSPPRLLVTVTGVVRHTSPSKLTSQPISARSIPQHTTDTLPTGTDLEYVLPNALPSALSNDAGGSGRNKGKEMLDEETIKGLPRAFVEVFELVAEEEGRGAGSTQPKVCPDLEISRLSMKKLIDVGAKFYILRDTFRFVG